MRFSLSLLGSSVTLGLFAAVVLAPDGFAQSAPKGGVNFKRSILPQKAEPLGVNMQAGVTSGRAKAL